MKAETQLSPPILIVLVLLIVLAPSPSLTNAELSARAPLRGLRVAANQFPLLNPHPPPPMSIPAALTWELFDRGRWGLPAAALGALVFPMILLSALQQEGALNADDTGMLIMHFALVGTNLVMFGAALVSNSWNMARLHAYPATNATLVTWRLLPAMVVMYVETLAWTAALNALYHLDWPLWGPALMSTVALAAVIAVLWLTLNSRWMIVAQLVLALALGMLFNSRYGDMFGGPAHYWTDVTPAEILVLIAIAAISWRVAVFALARNRCGQPPFSLGILAGIERLLRRAPSAARVYRSPAHAQYWYHLRSGWVAPSITIAVLLVGFTIWLFTSRQTDDLVRSVIGLAGFIMLGAFVGGLVVGDVSSGRDGIMSSFLATRPMGTADHARTALLAGAASLLSAWAVWTVAALLAFGACALFGALPSSLIPHDQDWRSIPSALIASWILLGNLTAVILTGRPQGFVKLVLLVIVGNIALQLAAKYTLSPATRHQVAVAFAIAFGLACLLGTLAAFVAARRRGLIDAPTAWASLGAWAAIVGLTILALPPTPALHESSYVALVGLLALAVAPLAAAPLALAWNRHR